MDVRDFTVDDFLNGTKPFELVDKERDDLKREQLIIRMADLCNNFETKINFTKLYDAYKKSQRNSTEHVSECSGQPMQLKTGAWICDDDGVRRWVKGQLVTACLHPVIVTTRLVNIESYSEKLELAYRNGTKWRTAIFDRSVLASPSKILELADHGISVTAGCAKYLIEYLNEIQELNRDTIPKMESVSRLGWFGERFVPYGSGLMFDGEDKFKGFYDTVQEHGDKETWYKAAREVRARDAIVPRVVLAASLASPLVKICNGLPFFVHIWGDTEAGKTLALMLGASVWANPDVGAYVRSFNATQVGLEVSAAFVNNLPLMLDELQMIKQVKNFDNLIYQLAEGTGRSRGDKSGGVRTMYHWQNCIITTGEQPITAITSGGGAMNRTIEIKCGYEPLFGTGNEPVKMAALLKANYGFLGKDYIELLKNDEVVEDLKVYKTAITNRLSQEHEEITGKQKESIAILLAADYIATQYIFKDDRSLRPEDLVEYLGTKESIDGNRAAYDWLVGWINKNSQQFISDTKGPEDIKGGIYGKFTETGVIINRAVFNDACEKAEINSTALARWMKDHNVTDTTGGKKERLDKSMRIGGTVCRCLEIGKLPDDTDFEGVAESEEVPW